MEDFKNASARHMKDAEFLLRQQRWANADHLFGIAAECYLKAAIVAHPLLQSMRYRVHINALWNNLIAFANGRELHSLYQDLIEAVPFHDWRAEQRYFHEKHISEEVARKHKCGAERAREVFECVMLRGFE